MKKEIIILTIAFCLAPYISRAAAQVPITQEEIEAILERNQIDEVSSTSLPADLRSRLGQTVASTTDAIRPTVTDAVNKVEDAMATATNKISSTSDKIKNNLDNYKTQASSDLKETFLGQVADFFASIWNAIAGWFSNIFKEKS